VLQVTVVGDGASLAKVVPQDDDENYSINDDGDDSNPNADQKPLVMGHREDCLIVVALPVKLKPTSVKDKYIFLDTYIKKALWRWLRCVREQVIHMYILECKTVRLI